MIGHDAPNTRVDLIYRLRGLGMGGTILHIGAHPDDEDVGLMAYMAHKLGVRIVYWSATRGEGGQNRLGPDSQETLGIYRTWESQDVRAVDGGEALYGPFYDFGFSKTGEETLTRWGGREAVTEEVVRAIRLVQPQVVVGRWTGEPASDGHGHHQAVGLVTTEAFEAAGDPTRFPRLEREGLLPWRPEKLYFSTGGDWQPGEDDNQMGAVRPEFEAEGYTRIDSGEFDSTANRTYQEQAWIGFNHHKTQAMAFVPEKSPFFYYYALARSSAADPAESSASFHGGLDSTLTGLADQAGDGSEALRDKLEQVKAKADHALGQYRAGNAVEAGTTILDGATFLRELSRSPTASGQKTSALSIYLARKATDFEIAASRCFGLDLECLADSAHVTPGQRFRVSARLWNPRGISVSSSKFSFRLPADWGVESVESRVSGPVPASEAVFELTVPPDAELACPYWLRSTRDGYRYVWPEGDPAGLPLDPPLLQLECEITVGDHRFRLRAPAILREGYPGGFRELPVVVVPPISLHPKSNQEILPVRAEQQHLELRTVAFSSAYYRNTDGAGIDGVLRLEVPSGWQVTPQELPLSMAKAGDSLTVMFRVTIPGGTRAGVHRLRYVVRCQGRDYDVVLKPVRMNGPGLQGVVDGSTCVREQFVTSPAVNDVHLMDISFVPGLKYGYVPGAVEGVTDALAHFDLDLSVLSDDDVSYMDLEEFDAVVVGPNGYLMNGALRNNGSRFLEYVKQGGTLIVQYQGYDYQHGNYAPYPLGFDQPHDRVTREDAPVTVLEPDHFLFHQPNEITDADFDGWMHDRGMYFMGHWDHRYLPLLACNDSGEDPKSGGILLTTYGRGTFIYTAYSYFRQLPAGVLGAFRLFANVLAVPAATLLARARILQNVSLFAAMDDLQLQRVARILSERWHRDGDYICRQGDDTDVMYIVASGEVEIVKSVVGKADQVIYRAVSGEPIGELQVLGKRTRTASMRACGEVHLLVIEGPHFRELTHQDADMSDRVITMLVDKLSAAGED